MQLLIKKVLDKTNKNTIHTFSGSFEINPISIYHNKSEQHLNYDFSNVNLIQEVENERDYKRVVDSLIFLENAYVSIKIIENDSIKFSFIQEKNDIQTERIIKCKFKKDNFLYLENVYKECNGIPYLMGGCRHVKIRLTIDKDNNLILNKAVCDEAAVLFLFGGGRRYNKSYKFKRIN